MTSGFGFGAKTTATPTFGTSSITFGTPSTQAPTGFPFGVTPAAPSTTPSLFGTATPAATTAGILFGGTTTPGLFSTNTATVAPSFSFGTSAPSTGSGLTFVTSASAAAPSAGLGFGAAPLTSTLSFNLSNTAITTSAPALGLNLTNPISATTSAFGFGNNVTTTTTATGLSFNLGTTATATTGNNLFGLGGVGTSTAPSISIAPASTSTSIGLGGIATATQEKNTAITTQKEVPPKDQPLPNEILQTVEAFKTLIKQQRNHSSDITRCSVKDFRRVEQEIAHLNNQLNEIECQLQKNRQLAEKLKYDTAKTVQNVEMAQRTHDTPPGLQYENTAPLKFFLDLADQFERDMQNLKMQIEAADKYVKNNKSPHALTPQDLSMGMRRLHETFVALTGRLQSVHSQVESQKETYINIRKHLLQDSGNPFDNVVNIPKFQMTNMQSSLIRSPPKVATGPTPFNNLAFGNINPGSQQNISPQTYPNTGTNTGTGFVIPLGSSQTSNSSLFGSSFVQPSFNNSFQLQKPPTGNKRGKI